MPGLGKLDRVLHRLAVPNLADHDDVGRLAQCVFERRVPGLRIDADLALCHDAILMRMDVLDGILDRKYVAMRLLVAVADHGRERGGLAGSGATDDQHEATLVHDDLTKNRGQIEFLYRRYPCDDTAQNRPHRTALHESADTKTTNALRADGEIALLVLVELLGLSVTHDGADDDGALVRGKLLIAYRTHLAIDLHRRRESRGDKEIRPVLGDELLEQVLHQPRCLITFHECLR